MTNIGDTADTIFVLFLIAALLLSIFFGPLVAWYYRKHPRKKLGQDEWKK